MKLKITILFTLLTILVKAQDPNEKGNLPNYYSQRLNFGFLIGFNKADFIIDRSSDFHAFDSLKIIESTPKPGFNLGIVADFALHKYLTLRFTPNIAFCERSIDYTFKGYEDIVRVKNIESAFLNFPLDLKLRSKRVGNFGLYILGGGAYNMDLSSKKNLNAEISPVLAKQIVKLKRDDFSYEIGAGTEFYLMYFKFAIEAKMSIGTKNLLIKENTIFSNSVNKLNSKLFLISLTFEG